MRKIQNLKLKRKNYNLKFKSFKFLLKVFTFYFLLLPLSCYALSISSSELINNAKQYDGEVVEYQGEAIGDIMARSGFAWVNLNDGTNAIGVWTDKNLIPKDMFYLGSFRYTGDYLLVRGVFNKACIEHGGDLDIHAQNISLFKKGGPRKEESFEHKESVVLYFAGVLLCLLLISAIQKRKPGRK